MRKELEPTEQVTGSFTFGFIKPHILNTNLEGELKQYITDNNFEIVATQKVRLSPEEILDLYPHFREITPDPHNHRIVKANTAGDAEVFILWSPFLDTAERFRGLIGTVPSPASHGIGIRGKFGQDVYENAVHGSDTEADAVQELSVCAPSLAKLVAKEPSYRKRFKDILAKYNNIALE